MPDPHSGQLLPTCALVVTYRPEADIDALARTVLRQVKQLIVVDNGSDAVSIKIVRGLEKSVGASIQVIEQATNLGQASALNAGFTAAAAAGFEWVLCLDQDSKPAETLHDILLEAKLAYTGVSPVGIISSGFGLPPISGVEPQFGNHSYSEVTTAITSGSLISMEAFQRAGGFREDFFIDSVDHEFCFRLLDLGYKILLTRKVGLTHSIGAPGARRLLWKRPVTSNHSAARRYYMSRNRLVVFRQYAKKHPAWVKYMKRLHWREVIRWCLVEEHRCQKIYATLLGTFDAFRGKMGKLDSRFIR